MFSSDVPNPPGYMRRVLLLGDLLARAKRNQAGWKDLPSAPGVYVVFFRPNGQLHFSAHSGMAQYAKPTLCETLENKWRCICERASTDIIYVGKADDLHDRLRSLARFGVGRANNHHGGEWMWQIVEITTARVLVQTCPAGKQVSFENWLLKRFWEEHGEYPLANRTGPQGDVYWNP